MGMFQSLLHYVGAWEAVRYAKKPRLIPFIATSSIHMEYKLNKTKEEVLQIAIDMVKFTRSLGCDDIEFGVEDAARFLPSLFI